MKNSLPIPIQDYYNRNSRILFCPACESAAGSWECARVRDAKWFIMHASGLSVPVKGGGWIKAFDLEQLLLF